jgi:DNA-binding LacI/PurR family transcriptional regulator
MNKKDKPIVPTLNELSEHDVDIATGDEEQLFLEFLATLTGKGRREIALIAARLYVGSVGWQRLANSRLRGER